MSKGNDIEVTEEDDEYTLQKCYSKWYIANFPNSVSCGCPYTNMMQTSFRGKRNKGKPGRSKKGRNYALINAINQKGYLKGYPDWVAHDPRVFVRYEDDAIFLKFVPGFFIEFKTPKGGGVTSAHQKSVHRALRRRGHDVIVTNDFDYAKKRTLSFRRGFPLYKGEIKISKKTLRVDLPREPTRVNLLARQKIKKVRKMAQQKRQGWRVRRKKKK